MCIRDSSFTGIFISLEQEQEMCTSCLQSAPPGHGPSNSEHNLISYLQLRMSKSLSNVAMKASFKFSFPLPSDMFLAFSQFSSISFRTMTLEFKIDTTKQLFAGSHFSNTFG